MASTRTPVHRRASGLAAILAASVLVLGACSDDDGTDTDTPGGSPATEEADIRGTETDPAVEGGEGEADDGGTGAGAGPTEGDDEDGGDGSTGAGGATETEGGVVGTTEG